LIESLAKTCNYFKIGKQNKIKEFIVFLLINFYLAFVLHTVDNHHSPPQTYDPHPKVEIVVRIISTFRLFL